MTRLIPSLLTVAAIWALYLAESHAETRASTRADDPACAAAAAAAAPDPAPAPGCPDLSNEARP